MNMKKKAVFFVIAALLSVAGCNYQTKTINWQAQLQPKVHVANGEQRSVLLKVADKRTRQSIGVSWKKQQATVLQLQQDLTLVTEQLLTQVMRKRGFAAQSFSTADIPQIQFELQQFEYKNKWPFVGGQADVLIKAIVTIRKGVSQKVKIFEVARPVSNQHLSKSLYEAYQAFLLDVMDDQALQAFFA